VEKKAAYNTAQRYKTGFFSLGYRPGDQIDHVRARADNQDKGSEGKKE
jgi:hypothetical protein